MKRNLLLILLASAVLAGCGSDRNINADPLPYADLGEVYQGVTDTQDQLIRGLDAAGDGKKVAEVLRAYTARMRDLAPRVKEAQAKYPELETLDTPPSELKATVEALNQSSGAMMNSLVKVQQFLEDPEVTAAMDDLSAAARGF